MTVAGVRSSSSTGVERYVRLLAGALAAEHVEYLCAAEPVRGCDAHWHLANSSRGVAWQAPRHRRPFVVTVHDVIPRAAVLERAYARFVYPLVVERAVRIIVHSSFAADLLAARSGVDVARLDVVPHPVPRGPSLSRVEARALLGWDGGELVAVLPGAARSVKLVAEALEATAGTPWRLALVGEPRDRGLVRLARESGACVLPSPDYATYQRAFAGADCVLVLRRGSVGETNGPLLDALGAKRAVLATATGSIPEVADGAVELCEPTVRSIRGGLLDLADASRRTELEELAGRRALALDWADSARAHRAIFEEVFG
jgi:glycosyltransferase involved in cell wall biosynthesis